jgi:hypothetical protein
VPTTDAAPGAAGREGGALGCWRVGKDGGRLGAARGGRGACTLPKDGCAGGLAPTDGGAGARDGEEEACFAAASAAATRSAEMAAADLGLAGGCAGLLGISRPTTGAAGAADGVLGLWRGGRGGGRLGAGRGNGGGEEALVVVGGTEGLPSPAGDAVRRGGGGLPCCVGAGRKGGPTGFARAGRAELTGKEIFTGGGVLTNGGALTGCALTADCGSSAGAGSVAAGGSTLLGTGSGLGFAVVPEGLDLGAESLSLFLTNTNTSSTFSPGTTLECVLMFSCGKASLISGSS